MLAAKRGEQEEEEARWLEGVFIYSLPSGPLWFQGDMATLVLGPLALVCLWPALALPKPLALNFLALCCPLFLLYCFAFGSCLGFHCTLFYTVQHYLSFFGSLYLSALVKDVILLLVSFTSLFS